jgi:zinc protease
VYDLQIAQDVSANQASAQLSSQFSIVATAQPKHTTDELRKVIDEELSKLLSGGISPDELARAKTGETSNLIFDLERDGSRANRINSYNQLAGDPAYLSTDLARYSQATPEAIVAAVKRYLPLDRRVVAVVTPKKGAPLAGVLTSRPSGGAS